MKENAFRSFIFLFLTAYLSCVNSNSGKSPESSGCQYEASLLSIIKSSNFPFEKADLDKINILVDNTGDSFISLKVFFETDGSGTLGWARLDLFDGELYNTSTYLENPEKLNYNKDLFKTLKDQCPDLFKAFNIKCSASGAENASLKDFIKEIPRNNLPISFESMDDFKTVLFPSKYISTNSTLKDYFEVHVGLMPDYQNKTVLIFNCSYESGYSEIYLGVLDENAAIKQLTLLYFHGAPDGNIEKYEYSTFTITKNYDIEITTFKVQEDLETGKILKKEPDKKILHINEKGEVN